MRIAFIGDLHGDVGTTRRIIQQLPTDLDLILQVGDFGYWPNRNDFHAWTKCFDDLYSLARLGFYWIDGNHEDHFGIAVASASERIVFEGYLPRNTVTTFEDVSVLALGGAISIDRYHRTEGKNWNRDEAPSLVELSDGYVAAQKLASLPTLPIVVSHEAPAVRVPFQGLPFTLPEELLFASAVHRLALEQTYRTISEQRDDLVWVHGHWHEYGVYIPGVHESHFTELGTSGSVVALNESRAPFEEVVKILDTETNEWR